MDIQKNTVAVIDYTLSTQSGQPIDNASKSVYLHGYHHLLIGMEEALEGKQVGDKVSTEIVPEKAFGIKSQRDPIRVPEEQFGPDFDKIYEGMSIVMQDDTGAELRLFVQEKRDLWVTLSANHPLAGLILVFNAKVCAIRPALDGEVTREIAFGPDGNDMPVGCACC